MPLRPPQSSQPWLQLVHSQSRKAESSVEQEVSTGQFVSPGQLVSPRQQSLSEQQSLLEQQHESAGLAPRSGPQPRVEKAEIERESAAASTKPALSEPASTGLSATGRAATKSASASSVSASSASAKSASANSASAKSAAAASERPLTAEDIEDGQLVALARAGESSAFEALYRRYSPYALALAVRVQGNATDVEDIVHDAFLKAHDRLSDLRADTSFRPWLAAVVVSLVRTRMRRRKMLSLLGLAGDEPIDLDALVTAEAGPEIRAQLAQVYATLRTVPVDQSICWTLRYVEGRKLEEVAQLAACSLATAKRRIASVQEKLALSQFTHPEADCSQEDSPCEGEEL